MFLRAKAFRVVQKPLNRFMHYIKWPYNYICLAEIIVVTACNTKFILMNGGTMAFKYKLNLSSHLEKKYIHLLLCCWKDQLALVWRYCVYKKVKTLLCRWRVVRLVAFKYVCANHCWYYSLSCALNEIINIHKISIQAFF